MTTLRSVTYHAKDGVAWTTLNRPAGIGRAKQLARFNENITPADARASGLVNRVCTPEALETTLAALVEKARRQTPTATAHTKRLLHESFHRDPRASVEDVLRAQADCMRSWETGEANRAWQEKREAVYSPRPGAGRQHGQ